MGVVAPDLDIKGIGAAVKISEGVPPNAYGAISGTSSIANGGLAAGGGFSDTTAQGAKQAHQYTFTFAPGVSASNFSLHMLDYGDFNPTGNNSHFASVTAYGVNDIVVDTQVLSYTSTGYVSGVWGDLLFTGDAIRALPGQPGDWTWSVSGSGIVKVVLEFGPGFDPNIGFDTIKYILQCP